MPVFCINVCFNGNPILERVMKILNPRSVWVVMDLSANFAWVVNDINSNLCNGFVEPILTPICSAYL